MLYLKQFSSSAFFQRSIKTRIPLILAREKFNTNLQIFQDWSLIFRNATTCTLFFIKYYWRIVEPKTSKNNYVWYSLNIGCCWKFGHRVFRRWALRYETQICPILTRLKNMFTYQFYSVSVFLFYVRFN